MGIALQLLFNSLVTGLVLAVMAVGFHLAFRTVKVFHLAHGAVFVAGAYLLIVLMVEGQPGFLQLPAMLGAAVGGGLIAWVMHQLVYRRLEKRQAGQEISLIASMGLYLLLVEAIALGFGNQARLAAVDHAGGYPFAGLVIAPAQLVQLLGASIALLALVALLRGSHGLPFRAVMSQGTVASVMGVHSDRIRTMAMVGSGLLAAWAGSLLVIDTGIHPHAGLGITLSAAVAVILGGARSFPSTIAAALLLAGLQTLTEWFLGAQWKEGITFLLLIVVLLWKTEGILTFDLRPEER